MAMIRATKLTMAEQAVIDRAIRSILNTWPGLEYGEFPGDGVPAEYELRLIKLRSSDADEPAKEQIAQNWDSADGKFHIEYC